MVQLGIQREKERGGEGGCSTRPPQQEVENVFFTILFILLEMFRLFCSVVSFGWLNKQIYVYINIHIFIFINVNSWTAAAMNIPNIDGRERRIILSPASVFQRRIFKNIKKQQQLLFLLLFVYLFVYLLGPPPQRFALFVIYLLFDEWDATAAAAAAAVVSCGTGSCWTAICTACDSTQHQSCQCFGLPLSLSPSTRRNEIFTCAIFMFLISLTKYIFINIYIYRFCRLQTRKMENWTPSWRNCAPWVRN